VLGTFAPVEISTAINVSAAGYDVVVFEMEHQPYDISNLRNCLQYLQSRRKTAESGSIAPTITPFVRIPANGSEMNQWLAKQVLDIGVYGVVWPHIKTVSEARNAVAACRYPRPKDDDRFEPAGNRGDSPKEAARYWGMSVGEYYDRADVWPLAPTGELFVVIMIESVEGVKNLPDILDQVPGIGAILIGEGDLSRDLGVPRQYDSPLLMSHIDEALKACQERGVPCGLPHQTADRVLSTLEKGFRWVQLTSSTSYKALETAKTFK
jgi:4-hydroxy-2-oxoheptanedioate aldolase